MKYLYKIFLLLQIFCVCRVGTSFTGSCRTRGRQSGCSLSRAWGSTWVQYTVHIVQYSKLQLICHRQGRKCVVRAAPEWAQWGVCRQIVSRSRVAPGSGDGGGAYTDTQIQRYKQMENTGNKIMSKIADEFSTLCTFLHRAADRYVDT